MPKNQSTFTIKGQLDISDITKGLDQIKSKVQSADLGAGLTDGLMKDINAISKKFETAFKNLPGVGTTSKQVGTFANKIQEASQDLFDLEKKLKDFGASEKYITEFITPIKKLSAELKKLTADTQKAVASAEKFEFAAPDEKAQVKTKLGTLQSKMRTAAKKGDRGSAETHYQEAKDYLTNRQTAAADKGDIEKANAIGAAIKNLDSDWGKLNKILSEVEQALAKQIAAQKNYDTAMADTVNNIGDNVKELAGDVGNLGKSTQDFGEDAEKLADDTRKLEEAERSIDGFSAKLKNLFSAATIFNTLSRVIRHTVQDFMALDKQFNEIAIVSDYSTQEMWNSFESVNRVAQEFGVTTENVLEVQNLYYHQGKSMAEVNKLTAQTLTLAKITGMDYADATSNLTAVLNAYNIAAEDAVRVTDTIAAMDTNAAISSEELMTALTKTASIAANAGMSLESTEVFLTKMIETTREAPENLGTALKTIIARFGEVKQEIDGEEIELADINRVDTALKSIGITLLDTSGQIRDLDGVFMELSSKWDDLDRNTQRYIATIAAGSRQQSRFIAMMENYDRTLELTEISQNSAGLGARQLAKSQESLESSINRVKASFQELTTTWLKAGWFKSGIDAVNNLLNAINKMSPAMQAVTVGLGLYILKTKILTPLLRNHKIITQGIIQGLSEEDIAKKIQIANEQKYSSALSTLFPKIKKYIDSVKQSTKAINDNTKAKVKNNAIPDPGENGGEEKKPSKEDRMRKMGLEDDFGKTQEYYEKLIEKKKRKGEGYDDIAELLNKRKRDDLVRAGDIKGIKENSSKWGKAGDLKGALGSVKNGIGNFFKGIWTTIKTGFAKVVSMITGAIGTAGATIVAAVAAVGVAILGAFLIWKTFFKASVDDTKKVEKLTEAQNKYNDSLTEYRNIQKNAAKYEELRYKKFKTAEQLEQEQSAAQALVEEYPHLLDYIDEEGNYHLKNADAIQQEIDNKRLLAEQNAKTYTNMRLSYAKQGIYADENSQAGAAMGNLKSFYSAMGKSDIKKLRKEIDAVGTLDGGLFQEFAEAYASGEKTSFNHKDFSNLFAGSLDAGEFEKLVAKFEETGGNIEAALLASGAYSESQRKDIAAVWTALNEQTGGLYQQLLMGIGDEVENIYVQEAELFVDNALQNTGLNEKAKAGTADKYANIKEDIYNQTYAQEKGAKDRAWSNVGTAAALGAAGGAGAGAAFGATGGTFVVPGLGTVGGAAAGAILGGLWGGLTAGATEMALYWDDLWGDPSEIANQKATEAAEAVVTGLENELTSSAEATTKLNNFYDNLGGMTLSELEAGVSGFGEYSQQLVNQELEKQAQYIKDFKAKIQSMDIKFSYSDANAGSLAQVIDNLTGDQVKRIEEIFAERGPEAAAAILHAIQQSGGNNSEINELLNLDYGNVEEVVAKIKELGLTLENDKERILDMIVAMDGIDSLIFDDLASGADKLQARIDKLVAGLEKISKLEAGEGDFQGIAALLQNLQSTGALENSEDVDTFLKNLSFTDNGAKYISDSGESLTDNAMAATALEVGAAREKIAQIEADGVVSKEEEIEYEKALGTAALGTAAIRQMAYEEWKAKQEGIIKGIKEEIELLKQERDAYAELVRAIQEYDYYQNLNRAIDDLEYEQENLEFEMEFSTNSDVIAKDIEKSINNVNNQIAANQAGKKAADENAAVYKDSLQKNYSDYVSFGEDGRVIVDNNKMLELDKQIAEAKASGQTEKAEALELEKQGIENTIKAYEDARKQSRQYNKDLQGNFKDLEKVLEKTYGDLAKAQNQIYEIIKKKEDKHLEDIKKNYESIQEENDKYLDNLQKMVDEERSIRDRQNQEDEVRDKEKKLAMMKMDTSGVYGSQIADLEKELEGDYQQLEDDTIDRQIAALQKQYDTEQELMDKNIEYMENALAYKRESYENYAEEVNAILCQGSDEALAWILANDESFIQETDANQILLRQQYEETMDKGVAANDAISSGLIDKVSAALDICKGSSEGFEGAIETYSSLALAQNDQISTSVSGMTEHYGELTTKVTGLEEAEQKLQGAIDEVDSAVGRLNEAENTHYNEQMGRLNELIAKWQEVARAAQEAQVETSQPTDGTKSQFKQTGSVAADAYVGSWDENLTLSLVEQDTDGTIYAYVTDFQGYYPASGIFDSTGTNGKSLESYLNGDLTKFNSLDKKGWNILGGTKGYSFYHKYAEGGYVDYTGPAWVDGTKSHPEYMLNATQTQQFETLVAAMDNMYSKGTPIKSQSTQNTGNAQYNFHINVDKMTSDYDVDQLASRLEEKMVKTSQYRNVTVLKKSQ